jgi:hypothetical protein
MTQVTEIAHAITLGPRPVGGSASGSRRDIPDLLP